MITCKVNGRKYVGKAIDPHARFEAHIKGASKSTLPLYNAIKSYGRSEFELQILEECANEVSAYESERRCIQNLRLSGEKLFNLNDGGVGNFSPIESVRKKMGDHWRGLKKSADQCSKISRALKGRKLSITAKENHARAMSLRKGCKLSTETRLKMSIGKKASITQAYRDAVGNRTRGTHLSDEIKQKLSQSNRTYDLQQAKAVYDDYCSGMKIKDLVVKHNVSTGTAYRMFSTWKKVSGGGRMLGCLPTRPDGTQVHVPEEQDFFDLLNVQWVEPRDRTSSKAVKAK